MKKLLQVIDGSNQKPVEGSNDIKKSLSIITEGANPHKVSLPVQMTMQHYQKPVEKKPAIKTSGLLQQYFENVELEQQQVQSQQLEEKREQLRMYSQKIAQRVLVKEAAMPAPMPTAAAPIAAPAPMATMPQDPMAAAEPTVGGDEVDTVTMDIPLMIRLFEYAREDAQTDMDLHNVAENLINLSKEIGTLSMEQYDAIVGSQAGEETPMAAPSMPVAEACWKDYKQVGLKKKGGKSVPNCVPKK